MYFIAKWDRQYEKRTWSGTTYGLWSELKKRESVTRIDVKERLIDKYIFNIIKSILTFNFKRNLNFNKYFQMKNGKVVSQQLKKNKIFKNEKVLQIGDLSKIKDSMIYQDLSISYLIKTKKTDPNAFKYSGFEDLSDQDLASRNKIQKKRYDSAKYILTMSKTLRDHLINDEKLNPNKVVHIGGGVNIDVSNIPPKDGKRNKILFVGRDFQRKGGDIVVNAFKLLQKSNLNLELYIAGPKELNKSYLGDGINFLGDIDENEIRKLLIKCDIFCMPSRFEAYGLVFAEALVYGLPCIGMNKFEMKNFIQDGKNGYLMNSEEPSELAKKIKKLLNTTEIFEYTKRNREKYISKYSWGNVAEEIIKLIIKL